ncbi:kinase-like domain-containing protein [Cokeromyces recurvatus]|uniref:kinase-like domain-containing protein n=1 Tax=Cokeromyces recurvatus TaxID=90255 RepID=UPI002220B95F|nr:kinase-like domain-containing protein [Cokeromyces recurvatus]KAI7905414.1 kinase-like domain-containing protein [Cokeromyces recurvatus]
MNNSQQATTIRLVLNKCNSSDIISYEHEQKNTTHQTENMQMDANTKNKDSDHGYESSETASYEYSEEEEEEEKEKEKEKEEGKQTNMNSTGCSKSISVASLLNDKNPFIPDEENKMTNSNPSESFERYLQQDDNNLSQAIRNNEVTQSFDKEYYINASKGLWEKVVQYSTEKNVPIVDINKYNVSTSSLPNAEGFFKHVFFLSHDKQKVVQTFRHMTISQRTTEIVGLLCLKGLRHMGQITEVLQESHGEIIGLCMERYEKTLKQYTHAHSHHRLTAHQKMDLIIQMLQCLETIHSIGLAHRDLSEVNFMVNETNEKLRDGSSKAELFLIDFGKSIFTDAKSYRHWWVEQPPAGVSGHDYDGEIVPKTRAELDQWCCRLPWIRSKPDHGYKLYRSIQTLPKSRIDTEDLPWLVNPIAEDLYSIGTIIWKTFAETEPWYGILDTDLKALRETVGQDYHIERALEREVAGELSRQLLLKFLKVSPDQRQSATEVLAWLQDIEIQDGLIHEWEQHAPVGRQKRHAKALFRFDEEQAAENERKKQRTSTFMK